MSLSRPDIFLYDDYRKFLDDYCAFLKKKSRSFSLTFLAAQAGVSKTLITLVIQGRRKLTSKAAEKVLPTLELSVPEQRYFRLLCRFENATTQEEKSLAIAELAGLKSYKRHHPKEAEAFRYLSKWHYVAIRELSALPDFEPNPEWIQKRLLKPVSVSEIEAALSFLKRHGFLEVKDDGRVVHPKKDVECLAAVYRTAMMQYHTQMFGLALENIQAVEMNEKHLVGHTVAVSANCFGQIKQKLDQTLQEIIGMASKDKNPELVFQISLLGFPMTQRLK